MELFNREKKGNSKAINSLNLSEKRRNKYFINIQEFSPRCNKNQNQEKNDSFNSNKFNRKYKYISINYRNQMKSNYDSKSYNHTCLKKKNIISQNNERNMKNKTKKAFKKIRVISNSLLLSDRIKNKSLNILSNNEPKNKNKLYTNNNENENRKTMNIQTD